MGEAFRLGGWGMYPTALFGVLLVAAAGWYAFRPVGSRHPLLWALGLLTWASGLLGFVTGAITTLTAACSGPGEASFVRLVAAGIGESLHNLALAFVLVAVALILCAIGALRLAVRKAGGQAAAGGGVAAGS